MVNGGHFKSVIWGLGPPFLTLFGNAFITMGFAAVMNPSAQAGISH
jgi:hypothetical protein